MLPERLGWRDAVAPVAIAIVLSLAVYVNIGVTPESYVTTGFFTIAVVLAVPCYSRNIIALVDAMAIAAYLCTVWIENGTPTSIWLIGVLTLSVVGVLGMWVANQRELAERHAQAAETERFRMERLLSLVSHELRGALTPLIGHIQLMQRRADGTLPERDQRALARVSEGAERLGRMIADLGDTHHLRSGRLKVERVPMDLAETVRQAIADVQRTADHVITLDAPEQLEGVWDSVRLYQAVRNLVSNASKYSPRGSSVQVRLYRARNAAVIEVRDEGEGISPFDQHRLFEPFLRFSDKNSAQGMGLGLYITKGIVEAHGGRITVESQVGRGSTFVVTLPISSHHAQLNAHNRSVLREEAVPVTETTT